MLEPTENVRTWEGFSSFHSKDFYLPKDNQREGIIRNVCDMSIGNVFENLFQEWITCHHKASARVLKCSLFQGLGEVLSS